MTGSFIILKANPAKKQPAVKKLIVGKNPGKTGFAIFVPRDIAILYLQWEFGSALANKFINEYPKNSKRWVDISDSTGLKTWGTGSKSSKLGIHTISAARKAAAKVMVVAAYQQGRLGKPLGSVATEIREK